MFAGIGRSPDTTIKKINLKHALDLDRRGLLHRQYDLPPVKDTIAVPNNGYVVFRFRADNPGWVFIQQIVPGNAWLIGSLFQSLAVPLSLPFPCDYRHEPNLACRNTSWFTARAAELPNMRRSFVWEKFQWSIDTQHFDNKY